MFADVMAHSLHFSEPLLMAQRKLHLLHQPAAKPTDRPPLLFVHGGYVHAGCWEINFLPFFAAQGFDCYALDLSGHGLSEGRMRLDSFGLDDYLDDVLQIIQTLDAKPVLIGHSMGAPVVERALERGEAAAGVLLSPVPTVGTQGSAMNLALRFPRFFAEINNVSQGDFSEESLALMRDVYFSAEMPPEELVQFMHLIQPESQRAVADMLVLGWRFHRTRPNLPVLVMGGADDAVFSPSMVGFTAQRWNARLEILPTTGHMLMLDTRWRTAAEKLASWLACLPARIARTTAAEKTTV